MWLRIYEYSNINITLYWLHTFLQIWLNNVWALIKINSTALSCFYVKFSLSISSLSKSWKGHTLIRTFFPWKSSVIIRAVSQGLGILYFCDSEFFLSLERTISQFCWGGNPAWWLYPYRWPPGSTGDSVELPALE